MSVCPRRVGFRPSILETLILTLACTATAIPVHAALLINEILYDPDGADSGREWVELHNTGPWPAPAEGLELQFANGSGPGSWTVVWAGGASEWIEPGQFFLVGERTDGPVDSSVRLGLQNGPDALRLVRDGFVLDLAGWGEPLSPELREGEAAETVAGGESLSRLDGVDTDDNARDFSPRTPSPGRPNFPRVDVAVRLEPPGGRLLPLDPSTVRLSGRVIVENRGLESVALGRVDCTIQGNRIVFGADSLRPGETISEGFREPAIELSGDAALVARVHLLADGDDRNDVDTLRVAWSESPVRLTEIHPRPVDSGPEWFELEALEPIALAGWWLEDASGSAVRLLPADSLLAGVLVVSSESGMGSVSSEGWPSLNDRAGGSGIADTLFVFDPSGRVRDWAVYGETSPGYSWIRTRGPPAADPRDLWIPDTRHLGGTPGRLTDAETGSLWPFPGGVSLQDHPDGAWIDLPPGTESYTFDVYDLRGRQVRRVSGRTRGERVRWDGRDGTGARLDAGVYVLDLHAETDRGASRRTATAVLDR
ncbi:MAG: lamin tail domain-containing protein [Candidatus Eisenbacteria bacterium]|uniref:Lamin tail domain-containing protein n=1 Tax=Eiseniibacteriota bacterium TaxID=2212470 RepID=A0A956NDV3_UNCEI|nr:lamin tail domain-containing protein [Candidatus Eisenbacteria bacterium]MCB9462313.1 lamin tail domain-containing protein [Candidatus Eisenbacteria bacterium]